MALEHVALVTRDMERAKIFYEKYFGGKATRWVQDDGNYELYFIAFDGGSRLEIQKRPDAKTIPEDRDNIVGIAHLAFLVVDREELRALTQRMIEDGVPLRTPPTEYGHNEFYESSFWDPDGNIVEISVDSNNL